jgi:hypothetical protein
MKTLSAFPTDPTSHNEFDTGMTLRDYFAAKAMQADISNGISPDEFALTAKRAYAMADEMIAARIPE